MSDNEFSNYPVGVQTEVCIDNPIVVPVGHSENPTDADLVIPKSPLGEVAGNVVPDYLAADYGASRGLADAKSKRTKKASTE